MKPEERIKAITEVTAAVIAANLSRDDLRERLYLVYQIATAPADTLEKMLKRGDLK